MSQHQQRPAQIDLEQVLIIRDSDLSREVIELYEPAIELVEGSAVPGMVTIRRDNAEWTVCGDIASDHGIGAVRLDRRGLPVVSAPSSMSGGQPSQTRYDFLPVRLVGFLNKATGERTPLAVISGAPPIFALEESDTLVVDTRPGAYYVTARHDGRSAALLGPFSQHLDAFRFYKLARHLGMEAVESDPRVRFGPDVSYGTSRLSDGFDPALTPKGRFNEQILGPLNDALLAAAVPDEVDSVAPSTPECAG